MKRNCVSVWCLFLTAAALGQQTKTLTLNGRVIDYNARPVAGATVVCYKSVNKLNQPSYESLGRAHTTSDGWFSLQVETESSHSYLVAGKQGLALGWRQTYSGSETIIRLGRPNQFKGTVVDEAGRPVPGAKVRICLKNEMMARQEITPIVPDDWFTTQTDSKGQFLFNNVPGGATADFGVEAPGMASIWTTCDFGPGQGEQFTAGRSDIRIVMPPEGCIKGRVVDEESGQALAGVKILARHISHANWPYVQDKVYSDSNGKFIITGLAPDKYLLHAMSDKKGAGNLTVAVEPGRTVSNIIVSLTWCPFEVIVYDAEKGGPIEDAYVTVTQKHATTKYTTFRQQLTTDVDGLARFCVPPGECEVQVIKFGYGAIFQSQRVQLEVGQKTRHEVSLPRTAIILSGEVLDEQGYTLSGASVIKTTFGPRTFTDTNGQFDTSDTHYHTSRLPSSVRVLARHTPSGLGAIALLRDPTKSGKLHGRIILKPAYELRGRVTDPAGKSIPAAYVRLLQRRYRYLFTEVTTDANGVYCIRSVPPPGDNIKDGYAIAACAEGFGLTQVNQIPFHDDTARPVHLDPIVLLPADEVISGVVEDSNDQPVAGALVSVYGPKLNIQLGQPPCGKTLTDTQGRFHITGVCKEPLHIYASSPSAQRLSGETWAHGGNENVRVVMGQKLIFSASLIGKPLPELKDLKIDLSPDDVGGKMLLVCFWDMEQRPSRACIRQLAKQNEQLKQKGVIVVAVQASKIDENKLNEWVKNNNIPFTVGMVQGDEEKTKFTWGVRSLPWLILTDPEHVVIAEGFGIDELDEKLKKNIDTEHAIQKNKATPTKPVAQTDLSDPAKSFLDAEAILAGWRSTYESIKSMRVLYSHRLLDYKPPANNPDAPAPVAYSYIEKIEEGKRYHMRYSSAEDTFDRPESLAEHAFDGRVTRGYFGVVKSGSIVPGLTGKYPELTNDLKDYMLMNTERVRKYLNEYPDGIPKFVRLFRRHMSSATITIRPNLESVAGQLCHVVEFSLAVPYHDGKYILWIAHDRGMCLMRYRAVHDLNKIKIENEIEVEQIAMAKTDTGAIWYPVKAYKTAVTTDEDGAYAEDGAWKNELIVKEFVPNVKVDENTFRFDFPKGTYVFDRVRGIAGIDLPKEPPSLVGRPLPELKDLKIDVSPTDARDKMILVCFWDMQQRPSRNCIKELAKQAQQLKQKGVTIVAVQASKIDENTLNEWLKKYNIPFTIGIVQGDVEKTKFTWGIRSLPWLILTDQENIVRSNGFSLAELNKKISAITQK